MTSRQFVAAVLQAYLAVPDTPDRLRPADRTLAAQLHDDGVALATVRAALLLATARRTFRDPSPGPLAPIRSLHYFLPVIKELGDSPPDPIYLKLLKMRLDSGFPNLHPSGAENPSSSRIG